MNHSYIAVDGFTVDGLHGSSSSKSGYRDKLIFAHGKGDRSGPKGLKITNMTFKNAGGECLRFRYFVQDSEVANNTFSNCGV